MKPGELIIRDVMSHSGPDNISTIDLATAGPT